MLICEVEKNMKERIRISIEEYHGHRFIDCRVYFEDAAGEWRPTKKGIALNEDTIDECIAGLQKGSAALEDVLSPMPAERKPRPGAEKTTPGAEAGSLKTDGRSISERVRAWVASVNGIDQFQSKSIAIDLGLTKQKDKHLVNVVLAQLAGEGMIERTGNGRGSYRRCQGEATGVGRQ
ncbi:MAG: transcriptional coactivator p15/PC4 family protein [Syntrophorhabdales bacterium]|jgi:hypothetical protein